VALLTVTTALPVDVNVSDWVDGEFKFTSPKVMAEALTFSVDTPALSPTPLKGITVDFPDDELLVRVNEPEAAPAVLGSNSTAKVTL